MQEDGNTTTGSHILDEFEQAVEEIITPDEWSARAKRRWFISDGTHYYSRGHVARNKFVAKGLVHAFPRGQPASATCLVL